MNPTPDMAPAEQFSPAPPQSRGGGIFAGRSLRDLLPAWALPHPDVTRLRGLDVRLGRSRRSVVRVLLVDGHSKPEQVAVLGMLERGGHLTDLVTSTSNVVQAMTNYLARLKRADKVGMFDWSEFRNSGLLADSSSPSIDLATLPGSIHVVSVGHDERQSMLKAKFSYRLFALRLDVAVDTEPPQPHRVLTGVGLSPYVDVTGFLSVEGADDDVQQIGQYFDK